MKYLYVKLLTALLLAACVIAALLTIQSPLIYYQEQHSLFLYSQAYVAHTLHTQGIMGLLGAFMVQFYHIPWLGASIVAALLVGVYLMTESIIGRLTRRRDAGQLGVAAAVALYFTLDGIGESPAWALVVFLGLGIAWLATLPLRRRAPDPKASMSRPLAVVALALAAAYLGGGYAVERRTSDPSQLAMMSAWQAIRQERWDDALAVANKFFASGKQSKTMLYFRNLALAQKGQLVDHLFDVDPTEGVESLAFPWRDNPDEAELGYLFHELTGDINCAHRWVSEALVFWGETAPHLYNLARYNVALGRPKVARKFADKLGQSLFYREAAERIRRQIRGEEPSDLVYAMPDSLPHRWLYNDNFCPALQQNYEASPDNKIARQYLMASMLLSNSLEKLIPMLEPADTRSPVIRQAMQLYSLNPAIYKPLSAFGLEVDEHTRSDFQRFYELGRRHDLGQMKSRFGKTFWYYVISRGGA